MAPNHHAVSQEAYRLGALPRAQARAQLGDRVARTFQLSGGDFAEALAFNAHLATELRKQAETRREPTIWDAV